MSFFRKDRGNGQKRPGRTDRPFDRVSFIPLRSGMGLVVNVLELFFNKLRVDLRGTDIGVSEHFLDGTQVRPVLQQMSREGMAKGMRRDILFDMGLDLIGFYDLPEALAGHALAADVYEQRRLVVVSDHLRADELDVLGKGADSGGIKRNKAFFIVADASDPGAREVQIRDVERW